MKVIGLSVSRRQTGVIFVVIDNDQDEKLIKTPLGSKLVKHLAEKLKPSEWEDEEIEIDNLDLMLDKVEIHDVSGSLKAIKEAQK